MSKPTQPSNRTEAQDPITVAKTTRKASAKSAELGLGSKLAKKTSQAKTSAKSADMQPAQPIDTQPTAKPNKKELEPSARVLRSRNKQQ